MQEKRKLSNITIYVVLTVLAVIFIVPIALVLMNSLKNKLYISKHLLNCPMRKASEDLKTIQKDLQKSTFLTVSDTPSLSRWFP